MPVSLDNVDSEVFSKWLAERRIIESVPNPWMRLLVRPLVLSLPGVQHKKGRIHVLPETTGQASHDRGPGAPKL